MCLVFAVLCHFGLLWRHAVLTTKNLVATVVSTGSLYPLFECEGGGGGGGGHVNEHVCEYVNRHACLTAKTCAHMHGCLRF